MNGPRHSRWEVINRYLATAIGSHRIPTWSLGPAREAAFSGVWDDLVAAALSPVARPVTDSNMNTSCVYEVDGEGTLYVSTVLPFVIAWDAERRAFSDTAPPWAEHLTGFGFAYMDSSSTRTLSPYVDAEADRRITYFELLFEWIEGSDGPDPSTLVGQRDIYRQQGI
ncbi:hypothetical protein [Glycomyces harbinensis]|uniref:Uncharacterized protein n=1 Tax=Glycomyces harbinensis TaxID=58114 RepID=A0A1G6ZJA5_9ACTN|nr:hypothetical protein [Glycomyces harbinensis]SDE02397.1 hypothetical protein SAMN05216270_11125 [Glycomyces harbinensis]